MKIRAYIAALLVSIAAVTVLTGCEAEKEDNLRVVDYSYVLQRYTDQGPEFSFYMYAYSYVRGPIADFLVTSQGRTLQERMVREDLYETTEYFGSFREATAPHFFTAVSERNQSVTSEVRHQLTNDKILGEIQVSDISYDGKEITIRISNVDNANYYGFFAIPAATGAGGEVEFFRAGGGRPYLQEAIESYKLEGRTIYPSEQIVSAEIDPQRYEGHVKIVPVAVYESDAGRIILESDYHIVIYAGSNITM